MAMGTLLDDYSLAELDAEAARRARTWFAWLDAAFPAHVAGGFAPYHAAFWDWVWSLERGVRPRPFVAIWPRGFGKSTNAELAVAAVACRGTRRYALYVSETQEQADDHVQNIAALLESDVVALAYPGAGERSIGKHGNIKGWRRNRVRTASGFTVDAIGLDTAARGVKLDEARPDFLIFDDLDGKLDSLAVTEKKLVTLTHTLLPAGAADAAVLAVQNLVIPDGIFARLADTRADFLADRIVSGPHPAIENLTTEQCDGKAVITGGEPTWPAMGLNVCQRMIDAEGITAFRAERQHEVEAPAGGMFDRLDFAHVAWADLPGLVRSVVWVDPAVTNTDASDAHGIQADALGVDDRVYRLYSWEDRTSPEDALRRAILKAVELGAEAVGVETDQGGDVWASAYREASRQLVAEGLIQADQAPPFRSAKAGQGHGPKAHRAAQMLADYERGTIVHVIGTHGVLERALRRFPKTKPFDLVDAAYWSWRDLTEPSGLVIPHIPPPVSFAGESTWAGVNGGSGWEPIPGGFGGPSGSNWGW